MRKILLVDGTYVAFRALHSEAGKLVNGTLYGIMRTMLSLRRPQLFGDAEQVWLFDGALSLKRRRAICPQYKSGRYEAALKVLSKSGVGDGVGDDEFGGTATPQEIADSARQTAKEKMRSFYGQIGYAKEWLQAVGIPVSTDGGTFEADDYIARLVSGEFSQDKVVIVSSDSDLYQVLSERVSCFKFASSRGGRNKVSERFAEQGAGGTTTTLESFCKNTGLDEASDWAMVKAIAGCSTDTIAGAPGVGEKTVCQWLAGTLSLTSKRYKLLREGLFNKDLVTRNLRLVELPFDRDDEKTLGELDAELSRMWEDRNTCEDFVDAWDEKAAHWAMPSLIGKF